MLETVITPTPRPLSPPSRPRRLTPRTNTDDHSMTSNPSTHTPSDTYPRFKTLSFTLPRNRSSSAVSSSSSSSSSTRSTRALSPEAVLEDDDRDGGEGFEIRRRMSAKSISATATTPAATTPAATTPAATTPAAGAVGGGAGITNARGREREREWETGFGVRV
ncbi:uncharacterized protein EI97DRAFT_432924 [Westerdykella ornata]|uniref:Uncharacterized protein n=1 Tax=Westerdykella ornata TaxID=318751 RepID=A0A6A6JK90_WESOR|nr:uncharacterized protein EI97DRAFT_432924 [Westerdykella ornata]KAF2276674.1 hypothetical protein EI97DRAFT_432924 [Westerdykella ornata]